ncbi:hypothetical protein BASA83_012298 [Batrachochytrium salamandrivorans]|nr:hypothetical protein BASA83_012298 [Batrachochytrium salamandrivorans]
MSLTCQQEMMKHPQTTTFGFVKLDSVGNLVEEGKSTPFRWMSYNIPGLLLIEDLPAFVNGYPLCRIPIRNATVDARGNRIGIDEGRTCYIPRGEDASEWVVPDPREQEDAIKSIAGAEQSKSLSMGDYGLFTRFRGKQPEEFFTDAQLIQDFKDLLTFMLNRRNTVNGIRYGDDQSILGWQTGKRVGWLGRVAAAIADNTNISCGMIWSLRYHSIHGGFYTHFEKDDFWSYHVPGFAPTRGFTADEGSIVMTLRKHALKVQGRSPLEPYPIPSAPGLIEGVTPSALRWIGSAWASHYILSRRDCPEPGLCVATTNRESSPWKVIAEKVTDNVESGVESYTLIDTAIRAQSYCYRVPSSGCWWSYGARCCT